MQPKLYPGHYLDRLKATNLNAQNTLLKDAVFLPDIEFIRALEFAFQKPELHETAARLYTAKVNQMVHVPKGLTTSYLAYRDGLIRQFRDANYMGQKHETVQRELGRLKNSLDPESLQKLVRNHLDSTDFIKRRFAWENADRVKDDSVLLPLLREELKNKITSALPLIRRLPKDEAGNYIESVLLKDPTDFEATQYLDLLSDAQAQRHFDRLLDNCQSHGQYYVAKAINLYPAQSKLSAGYQDKLEATLKYGLKSQSRQVLSAVLDNAQFYKGGKLDDATLGQMKALATEKALAVKDTDYPNWDYLLHQLN